MKKSIALLVALVMTLGACGGSDGDSSDTTRSSDGTVAAGDATHGEELYANTCMGCHGPNAEGVEGLGKPLAESDFIDDHTDAELLAFLIEGRPSDHPDNTTGVPMPARGGNPDLTDADLLDLIAFIRTLNP